MREAGALTRRRAIRTASDLLRLCFAFVLGRQSLRMLATKVEERPPKKHGVMPV